MQTMTVLLFGPLRDLVGADQLTVEVMAPWSGTELFDVLATRYPGLRAWRSSVRLAVNQEYVPFDRVLRAGDELCLIPPVSGG